MTEEEFKEHIKYLKDIPNDEPISCDTENSGTVRAAELWSGQHYGTGISLAYRHGESFRAGYFPFRHEENNLDLRLLDELKPILLSHPLIFHNEVIDMAGLSTLGIEITIPPYDTTVMAHLVNEEFPSKSLEWLSRFILKEGKDKTALDKWIRLWGWGPEIPVDLMEPYGKQDAILPFRLFDIFMENLK